MMPCFRNTYWLWVPVALLGCEAGEDVKEMAVADTTTAAAVTDSAAVNQGTGTGVGVSGGMGGNDSTTVAILNLSRDVDEWNICSYKQRYPVADSGRWLHLDVAVKGPNPKLELAKEFYVEAVVTYDSAGRAPVRGPDLVDTVYIEAGPNSETMLLRATGIRYHSRMGSGPVESSTRTAGPQMGPLTGTWPCEPRNRR